MKKKNKHGIPQLKPTQTPRWTQRLFEGDVDEIEKRLMIFAKCHGHCFYCGIKMVFAHSTIDHLNPRSNGGGDETENLVPACKRCNQDKQNLSLVDFRKRFFKGDTDRKFHGERSLEFKRMPNYE